MIPLYFPINQTSLGASAFHIVEHLEEPFSLFPLGGGVSVEAFEPVSNEIKQKINVALENCALRHSVNVPAVKLWHQFLGYERISKEQILFTFHELDHLTPMEVNNLNQQTAIIVPCSFNKKVFESCGVTPPIHVVPLGVDRSVFYPLEKHQKKEGPFIFLMAGKFEARKCHLEILQAFAFAFGNNKDVKLRCCIANRFMDMKQVMALINSRAFNGKPPSNVEFIDWLPTERHFADFLSHGDCLITPSRGESFNLPLLQAMSCGISVITNKDHAHADYATEENAIICPSHGSQSAVDGIFFKGDGKTNTGNWFNIHSNDIAECLLRAVKQRQLNEKGIETAKNFSWKKTAEQVAKIWHSLKT